MMTLAPIALTSAAFSLIFRWTQHACKIRLDFNHIIFTIVLGSGVVMTFAGFIFPSLISTFAPVRLWRLEVMMMHALPLGLVLIAAGLPGVIVSLIWRYLSDSLIKNDIGGKNK
ncbi:hypothetical protein [Alteribacter natronophilus]|uniref:hypothetical protein n=1 Tax=Alteribacter natronophilus TaxID=2583810 RepID=UPI00110F1DCF|nr:hypothetical protein [Alteribacter natronophilus]TMW72886.1 hypothetical protein FGB90_00810 [Alteribacter natronophilus]